MVEIKVRNGKVGKCHTSVDVQLEGSIKEIYWSMVELEEAVWEILSKLEDEAGLEVKKGFVHNLHDRYLDEKLYCDD